MHLLILKVRGEFNASLFTTLCGQMKVFLYREVHVKKMETIVFMRENENRNALQTSSKPIHMTWYAEDCYYIIDISLITAYNKLKPYTVEVCS